MSTATQKLSEKMFTKQIVSFMRAHRWRAIRLQSGLFSRPLSGNRIRIGEAGMPDWLFLRNRAVGGISCLFLELKASGGKMSGDQIRWHEQANREGLESRCFNKLDDFLLFYQRRYVD